MVPQLQAASRARHRVRYSLNRLAAMPAKLVWKRPMKSRRIILPAVIAALAAGLLGLTLGHMPAHAAGDGAAGVTIPNFWDPKRRVERPAAGAVQAIRFVTTDDFPPFNFLDADGHLTGFNIDLARAICTELAIRCTIQARPFDDLAHSLETKTADAAIAGIAITADSRAV